MRLKKILSSNIIFHKRKGETVNERGKARERVMVEKEKKKKEKKVHDVFFECPDLNTFCCKELNSL